MTHRLLLVPFLVLLFIPSWLVPSEGPSSAGAAPVSAPSVQRGGRYVTAQGNLNVLFVYLQFPDDAYLPDDPSWPRGKAPTFMNSTVDESWSPHATPGGFTDYFNQMSFNKLRITGKAVFMVTPHSRKWYLDNNWQRGAIHTEVLQKLNRSMDFRPFDHWKFNRDYSQTAMDKGDGVIDMLFMMWRNVSSDTVDLRRRLDLVPGGEASLGGGNEVKVDGNERTVQMGHEGYGSGLTIINPVNPGNLKPDVLWRYARHEFGHWLLGGNEYHTGLGVWGLLDGWGTPGGCMNSFERERLGWIEVKTINYTGYPHPTTIRDLVLPDFVTTGVAYWLKVPGGGADEYYLLENHQRISSFDVPDNNVPGARGLFLIHQPQADGENKMSLVSAEGRYEWSVPYQSPNVYGGEGMLPVFRRGAASRVHGYTERQAVPWKWQGKEMGSAPIHYYENACGDLVKAPPTIFTGDGRDQFDTGYATVFTPASNPSSDLYGDKNKIGFEITNVKDGVYTISVFINTTESASPSRPQDLHVKTGARSANVLSWSPNAERRVKSGGGYNVYRANDGDRPSYHKLNRSVVKKTTYADSRWRAGNSSSGTRPAVLYRVTAVDSRGRESAGSDAVRVPCGK